MKPGLANKDEYLRALGKVCPRCRSDQLVFLQSKNNLDAFIERINCAVCDLDFERIFYLDGYQLVAT
jgi:hypothetical protein